MRPMTRTAVASDAATMPPRKVSVDCSSRKAISASRTPRARGTAYDPNRPQRDGATHDASRGLAQANASAAPAMSPMTWVSVP